MKADPKADLTTQNSLDLNKFEVERLIKIPTEQPEAALEFCRALSDLLRLRDQEQGFFGIHTAKPKPVLSVVIPVYNEVENLPEL